jgi:hypothetical protein
MIKVYFDNLFETKKQKQTILKLMVEIDMIAYDTSIHEDIKSELILDKLKEIKIIESELFIKSNDKLTLS